MEEKQLDDFDCIRYTNLLTELSEILYASNNNAQAKVVDGLLALLKRKEHSTFSNAINSVDMWGGSGAVWEVYLDNPDQNKKFKQIIIDLISLMENTYLMGKGIKRIRKLFGEQND